MLAILSAVVTCALENYDTKLLDRYRMVGISGKISKRQACLGLKRETFTVFCGVTAVAAGFAMMCLQALRRRQLRVHLLMFVTEYGWMVITLCTFLRLAAGILRGCMATRIRI